MARQSTARCSSYSSHLLVCRPKMIPRYFLWMGEIFPMNEIKERGEWNIPANFRILSISIKHIQLLCLTFLRIKVEKHHSRHESTWMSYRENSQIKPLPLKKDMNSVPKSFIPKMHQTRNQVWWHLRHYFWTDMLQLCKTHLLIRSHFQLKLHNIIIRYRNPSNVDGHSLP